MKIKPFKYSIILIFALIFPTLSVVGYNFYIDPFQIIHKNFKKPYILFGGRGTDRYQHAGIINNYPVQSIILGNSRSANFLPSKLEKELKVKNPYSLTMDGAPIFEQAFPARYALETKNVEYVLWGVSGKTLMQKSNQRNIKMQLPDYLYDENRFNDLQFFLTFDFLKYQRQKELRKLEIINDPDPKKKQQQEFDQATSWYKKHAISFDRPLFVAGQIFKKKELNYSQFQMGKLKPLNANVFRGEINKNKKFIQKMLDRSNGNIRKNILPLVEENPEVMFDFAFTAFPTVRGQFDKIYRSMLYVASLLTLKNFTTLMSEYPNVRVFAFGLENFTDELRLYKDPGHYHIEVNNFIIESIGQNKNYLNKYNIEDYLVLFDKKISQYRLPEKWNPILKNRISAKGKKISLVEARKLM